MSKRRRVNFSSAADVDHPARRFSAPIIIHHRASWHGKGAPSGHLPNPWSLCPQSWVVSKLTGASRVPPGDSRVIPGL
eukprot:2803491-Pyramimonas_sp.AAC.1